MKAPFRVSCQKFTHGLIQFMSSSNLESINRPTLCCQLRACEFLLSLSARLTRTEAHAAGAGWGWVQHESSHSERP